MFQRRAEGGTWVTVYLDDKPMQARAGENLAAALFAAQQNWFRETAIHGEKRAPYCMIGACYDCLVEIDGAPNQRACMAEVRDGMRVRPQRGSHAPA